MRKALPPLAGWLATGLLLALLLVAFVIPRLTGWVPLTVLSGSMEPTIPTGSLVVVERVHGEADLAGIGTGEVITFMPHPDDPTLVTHRVVSAGARADGTTVFVTQGDANAAPDPEPVGTQQVRGLVRYHVPYAGYLSRLLSVEQKRTGVFLAAALLFAYAGVQVVRALRPTSRTTKGGRHSGGAGRPAPPPSPDPAVEPSAVDVWAAGALPAQDDRPGLRLAHRRPMAGAQRSSR